MTSTNIQEIQLKTFHKRGSGSTSLGASLNPFRQSFTSQNAADSAVSSRSQMLTDYMIAIKKKGNESAIKKNLKEQLDQQIREKTIQKQKERIFLNNKELATSKELLISISPELVKKDRIKDISVLDNNLGSEIDRLNRLILN